MQLDKLNPEELLQLIAQGEIRNEMLPRAIARIAKPYSQERIKRAKATVAMLLNNPDPSVRHEAIWFLGCWAKCTEYQAAIVNAFRHDPDPDNRGFAATCLGVLGKGKSEPVLMRILADTVKDDSEEDHVRLKAYAGLINAAGKSISPGDEFDFSVGRKPLNEIDWEWVSSILP